MYTNNEFLINEIHLVYYRVPQRCDIIGYTRENGEASANSDLEFKDDTAELILDDAAAIIAGSIESLNQYQINKDKNK